MRSAPPAPPRRLRAADPGRQAPAAPPARPAAPAARRPERRWFGCPAGLAPLPSGCRGSGRHSGRRAERLRPAVPAARPAAPAAARLLGWLLLASRRGFWRRLILCGLFRCGLLRCGLFACRSLRRRLRRSGAGCSAGACSAGACSAGACSAGAAGSGAGSACGAGSGAGSACRRGFGLQPAGAGSGSAAAAGSGAGCSAAGGCSAGAGAGAALRLEALAQAAGSGCGSGAGCRFWGRLLGRSLLLGGACCSAAGSLVFGSAVFALAFLLREDQRRIRAGIEWPCPTAGTRPTARMPSAGRSRYLPESVVGVSSVYSPGFWVSLSPPKPAVSGFGSAASAFAPLSGDSRTASWQYRVREKAACFRLTFGPRGITCAPWLGLSGKPRRSRR